MRPNRVVLVAALVLLVVGLAVYYEVTQGRPSNQNTVVATVTVTEGTLTTQASQASTTYAIPTSSCTIMPVNVFTITTVTVGPKPPASTTTMTTTLTSYAQTVTVTSCRYSIPMVTYTVTTTATP